MSSFIYLVTLTNGKSVRVECAEWEDPTDHPTFYGRVASVTTIGLAGKHLSTV